MQVSQPGDALEREADAAAARVMVNDAQPLRLSRASGPRVQRKCAACELDQPCTAGCSDEEPIAVQRMAADTRAAPSVSSAILPHRMSDGAPLEPVDRARMEHHFGFNFVNVRIHADQAAAASARSLNARAFTVGPHVVFAAGAYRPSSVAGRRLLAHELAHVVQQASGASTGVQRAPDHAASDRDRGCAQGMAPDDPACAVEATARAYGPEQAIPVERLGTPPSGVGLRVPTHPKAVRGIHDWTSTYGVPEGRATVRNVFTVGSFVVQQVCAVDEIGAARVYVYRAASADSVYAVGPDALADFVARHGGIMTARPSNRDELARPTGMDARKLPAAPFAFNEAPQLVYVAPRLPIAHEPDVPPARFQVGAYLMRPYVRLLGNGTWSVLYYVAERSVSEFGGYRAEYVVGPLWLDRFTADVDWYANIAVLGFMTIGGGPPPEYAQRAARAMAGMWHNDPERAKEWLESWKAAAKDPMWWLQVGMGYVGATEPAPSAPRPAPGAGPAQFQVLKGGGVATQVAPAPVAPLVRAPMVGRGGAAQALAKQAAVEPVVAAAPVTLSPPRPRPQLVPEGARPPARPPSRLASGAILGARGGTPISASASQQALKPTMPAGLSTSDQQLWRQCNQQYKTYKKTQGEVAAYAGVIGPLQDRIVQKRATPQDLLDMCSLVEQRIATAKRLHQERQRYIELDCDKFDWFVNGTTKAARLASHQDELLNVANLLRNLYNLKNRFCP